MESGEVPLTRKRQQHEESHRMPPRSSSLCQLTQFEITSSFQEAQAYFSEKGTFQCPFCANHINHNYLQTHIEYCSNLFEQFYLPPIRNNGVDEQAALSLNSNSGEQSPVIKHRIQCLIHGLKRDQACDMFVTEKLAKAGLIVKFANIKVPSAKAFSKLNRKMRIIDYSEKCLVQEIYYYDTKAKCYVELESTNDAETLFILHNTFNKNTITVLPKQNVETFIHPNFNWYPDIMSIILSYFQSPPENTKGFHQANSYIQIFSNYYFKCVGDLNQWPFYFIRLAMQIENKFFPHIPLKWQLNKRIIIAALESRSVYSKHVMKDIPSSLQEDVDVLVAMSLTDPNHFSKIPKEKIDKNFILHCLDYGVCSSIVKNMPEELLNDGAFILKLLQKDSECIHYISDPVISAEAFADEEITSQMLAINGNLLHFAPYHVKMNRKLVLIAVKQNGNSFGYACSFRGDKEIVLAAVQQSGCALKFATTKLLQNKQIVMAAIRNDLRALRYAYRKLHNDKQVIALVNELKMQKQITELKKSQQREYTSHASGTVANAPSIPNGTSAPTVLPDSINFT